ncbi:hypothetical protein GmHk_U059762 [Glycine max]|nr:hypothetical protein GmHk_U059762 [Glycine max]
MSPPPLDPHNHSQTHLMLLGWLPLVAQFSASLFTAKALKTLLNLDLSLLTTTDCSLKGVGLNLPTS